MAKPTEKQLFGTLLDIYYARGLQSNLVTDMKDEAKEAAKRLRKINKELEKGIGLYKELYNKEPNFKR